MLSLFYGPTTNVPITQIKSLSSFFVNWEVWGNLEFGNVKTDCQSFRCIEGVGLKLWLRQQNVFFWYANFLNFILGTLEIHDNDIFGETTYEHNHGSPSHQQYGYVGRSKITSCILSKVHPES